MFSREVARVNTMTLLWLLTWIIGLALNAQAQTKDSIILGYTGSSGIFAGQWIAQEAGLYDKYGIHADQVLLPGASRMVQAMLGGDVPFASAGGNAAVDANLAGGDFVMVGSLAKVPAFYIMALPEIKSVKDLRGKAVGVARLNSATDFTMRYVLRANGLEPDKDVKIIQTGDVFAGAAAMSSGLIVAAPFSSPANLKAEAVGARVLLNMGKAGVY